MPIPRAQLGVVVAAAIAIGAAGCGATSEQRPQSPSTASAARGDTREQAIARRLDGHYGAELAAASLQMALSEIKPPVRLNGGWWTLTVDVGARRLNISNTGGDNVELRMTAIGDRHIELAPDAACEQRDAARTEPARLNWARNGHYLRFHAVNVPCLTDEVFLTLTARQRF